ncbi:MAG: peptidoglycan editing factor PgeF [Oscillospiraceae bacterium]|nr:peptidoglycan editing factor PgeF [Oscillospiraceae bacterium]MBR2890195.1 peptidoglycan editing factor PgeF [Oscillospiraceae bacterium]
MAFRNQKNGNLEYLTADSISVPHCFTTRLGGVSTGCLASLNLGIHRGDTRENLMENYRILGDAVGFRPEELVFTRQTHTDIVRIVDETNAGEGLFRPVEPECDGLITNVPGLTLAAFTADCTPILLHDPVTGAVGAVHAGWRGTVADIAGKAVRAMVAAYGCKPENIRAAIGPNIGFCCFETDRDVPDAVRALLGQESGEYIRTVGEKYRVDLKGVNRALLQRAGVRYIDVSCECTACRPDRFWSHRITGGSRGSQAGLIRCQGGK